MDEPVATLANPTFNETALKRLSGWACRQMSRTKHDTVLRELGSLLIDSGSSMPRAEEDSFSLTMPEGSSTGAADYVVPFPGIVDFFGTLQSQLRCAMAAATMVSLRGTAIISWERTRCCFKSGNSRDINIY